MGAVLRRDQPGSDRSLGSSPGGLTGLCQDPGWPLGSECERCVLLAGCPSLTFLGLCLLV